MTSLDGLRALEQAATPGPWSWLATGEKDNSWSLGTAVWSDDSPVSGAIHDQEQERWDDEAGEGDQAICVDLICEHYGVANTFADAALIVAARNALPGLLGRVAAAEAERDALLFRAERADAKIAEALGWLRDYCEAEECRPYLVTEAIGDLNWASDALAASVPSGPAAGGLTTSKETR